MRIKPVLQQCCKKSFIFHRCPFYLTLRYISFPGKWHLFKPFRAAYELWNSGFTNTSVNYLYECVYRCWRTRWPWLAAMDNECEKKRKIKKSYIVTYTFRDFCDIMVSNPNRLLHQMSPRVNRSWKQNKFRQQQDIPAMNKTSAYIYEVSSPYIHAVIRRQFISPHSNENSALKRGWNSCALYYSPTSRLFHWRLAFRVNCSTRTKRLWPSHLKANVSYWL